MPGGHTISQPTAETQPTEQERTEDSKCPVCKQTVLENEAAVTCDGTCQAWHHITCAELQQGQYNILKPSNKRKSKLLWLCEKCEPEFVMFKAGKNIQKELNSIREEFNAKLENLTEIILALTEKQNVKEKDVFHSDTRSPKFKEKKGNHRQLSYAHVASIGSLQNEKDRMESISQDNQEDTSQIEVQDEKENYESEVNDSIEVKRRKRRQESVPQHTQKNIKQIEIEDEEENYEREKNNDFIEMKRRKRRDRKITFGSKQPEGGDEKDHLQAATKTAWFYLGRLRENTTEETIKKYMIRSGYQGEIYCEELPSKGRMKAFKLGIPFTFITEIENAEFWPQGVLIRRFFFRRGETSHRGIEIK